MGKDYGEGAKLMLQDLKGSIGDSMDTLRGSIDPHHNIPIF